MLAALALSLPLGAVRRLGRALGRFAGVLARGRRALALENLERALPELDVAARERVVGDCFAHFGGAFLESFATLHRRREDMVGRFEIEGWEHIEAVEAEGTGYFLLTGHYGIWEPASHPLTDRLENLYGVARPFDNPLIWRRIEAIRERAGYRLITKRGAGHRMLNISRRGGKIGLLLDQKVRPRQGILLPFLGRPAWTSPLLATLSIHSGLPVVPMFCVPAPGGRYRLTFEPPIRPEGRGADAEAALTRRCLATIEARIRARPEWWLWMHRRWQLTAPERLPENIARLEAAANLPAAVSALAAAPSAPAVAPVVKMLARVETLESTAHVALAGPVERQQATAHAVARRLLAAGHAVRWASAAELVAELEAAERAGKAGEHFRKLDLLQLLLVDLSGDPAPALARLLAQRWRRRATLLFGVEDPAVYADLLPAPLGAEGDHEKVAIVDVT